MERPVMKRRWLLVLMVVVVFLVLLLAGTLATVYTARQRQLNATPTPSNIPTEAPSPTPLPNYHALSFDPDLDKMAGMGAVPEGYEEELGAAYWVDVTPANETIPGYTLFRHVELGYSFLLLPDGRYLRLGESGEGCGLVNGVYGDLDADGSWELLYTYTAETEEGPAARMGWLDLATLENRSAPFLLKNGTLALADDGGRLLLYRASLSATDSRGFYAIDLLSPLGEVMELDGALFLALE